MADKLQGVRGMNDLLPDETAGWQALEKMLREIMAQYGYGEIRLPLLERTQLFARAIGAVTDIVEKEMYTFLDRDKDSLTLRPEGTAGVVRAAIEHQLLRGQTPRLYYIGPMFRHERPQKGRYRQFHQIGVEAFGLPGPDVDAEQIALSARLLHQLDLRDVRLELNSLGTPEARVRYRERLVAYLEPHASALCANCQARLQRSPMRVLDCKEPGCQAVAADAPHLLDHLDEESLRHFEGLRQRLEQLGIAHTVNTRLVRGLDYYNRTVFEWKTDQLGAQGTVLAGGRYDGLVAQIGGPDTPAVGFAAGLERLLALWEVQRGRVPPTAVMLFLGALGERAALETLVWAERYRDRGVSVVTAQGGMKALFKAMERSGARYAALIGDAELDGAVVQVKAQDDTGTSFETSLDQLAQRLISECA